MLTVTTFPDRFARTLAEKQMTWPELCRMLEEPPRVASKDAAPLLKLARFGDLRSEKGSLRHDGNVREIHGIEGDYDGEQVAPYEAVWLLERAGIRAFVYTSPSHTSERPRWRVLCPLSKAHPPKDRSALVARLNGALEGILADESFVLSQAYFYGRINGRPYQAFATFDDPEGGECIDLLDELDNIAIGRVTSALPIAPTEHRQATARAEALVRQLGRKLRTGDGRRELLKSYIASRSARGLEAFEVRKLVHAFAEEYFDPADPMDADNVDAIVEWAARRDAKIAFAGAMAGFLPAGGMQTSTAPETPPESPQTALRDKLLDLAAPLPVYDEVPHYVDCWIPAGEVTLLAGHGGGGKSFVALMLAVHVALGRAVGLLPVKQANVLFYSAEDNKRILTLRLRKICAVLDIDPGNLAGRLHLLDVSDIDPTLFQPRRFTVAGEQVTLYDTPLVTKLKALVTELDVGLVVVDNASDTFAGDEIHRADVRRFVRGLRHHLATDDRAVLLLAHINKASAKGIESSEDYSGSTAWHNSVRSRLSLLPDETGLTIKQMKANIGPKAEPVRFEWVGGVPVVAGTTANVGADVAEQQDRAAVVALVREFNARGETISTSLTAHNGAFKMLRAEPGFPRGIRKAEQLASLLRAAERAGELRRETYLDSYRKPRERWVATSAPSAPSAPSWDEGATPMRAHEGAPSAPSCAWGYKGESAAQNVGV